MSILAISPFLIPLAGGLLILGSPEQAAIIRWRRPFYLLVLCATIVLLILAGTLTSGVVSVSSWGGFVLKDKVEFTLDWLALIISILLVGVFALVGTALLGNPLERVEGARDLALVATTVAACAASNLITLGLLWIIIEIFLMGRQSVHLPPQAAQQAVRRTFMSLLGVFALLTGTLWTAVQIGDTSFKTFVPAVVPSTALMLAAIMRLGALPLPEPRPRLWQNYLIALGTGTCLWLRLASLTYRTLPGAGWVVPFIMLGLLAGAIVAYLGSTFDTAWGYLRFYGILQIVLLPLLSPVTGTGIAIVAFVYLVAMEALIQLRPYHGLPAWPIGQRVPSLVALANLLSIPLTLGFALRWATLWLIWNSAWRGWLPILVVADLMIWAASWHKLRPELFHSQPTQASKPWMAIVALASSAVLSLVLLLVGFTPTLFGTLFPELAGSLAFPEWSVLWPSSLDFGFAAVSALILLPAGMAYLLRKEPGALPRPVARKLEQLRHTLTFKWLYDLLGRTLNGLGDLVAAALGVVEEHYLVGWVVFWSIILMLFISGR